MEQVIYTVKLDLTDNGCFDSGWRIKQGDNANSYLKVKVENNGVVYFNPLNLPEIVFHRPDGSTVVSVMSAGTDDFYTYTIVGNELAVAGNVVMDVKFTDSGRTSTASCTFLCVPDTISGDPSGASTYYNPISELIDQGEQIVEETDDNRLISEGYARGTQDGEEVGPESPYYHNNAKYYMEQSSEVSNITWDRVQNKPFSTIGNNLTVDQNGALNASAGLTELEELYDVNINGPANGQVLAYNAVTQKWINSSSGGGGGLLPHLIVTSTTGSTVTATKGLTVVTLTETSTGQFEADIPEFGTWDIEASLSGSTATYTLVVDTVKIYTVSLGYFNATITVTFPASSTCSCGKTGETPQTASVSPYTFTVHSVGIYTITATDGTHTKSDTVTITTDGQSESVTLTYVPDGSTVLPTDDIQIWLNCADIYDKTSYTTLSDVLADSTTLSALIADNNAVDYMKRSKSWCGVGLVPKMTSNTTPSGVCSGTNMLSGYDYYYAFNDDYTLTFNSTSGGIIQYQFPSPVMLNSYTISPMSDAQYASRFPNTSKCEVSTNGSDWTEISNVTLPYTQGSTTKVSAISSGTISYVRLTLSGTKGGTSYTQCHNIQFYSENICDNSTAMTYIGLNNYASNTLIADSDWLNAIGNSAYIESVLNVKNPEMTSNNTPSGIASSSGNYTNFEPWKAFNSLQSNGWYPETGTQGVLAGAWLEYEHTSNIKLFLAKVTYLYNNATANTLYFKIQHYYNSDWEDLSTQQTLVMPGSANASINVILDNSSLHASNKSRLYETQNSSSNSGNGFKVQFYGRVDV